MAESVKYPPGKLPDPRASWAERVLSRLFWREEIPGRKPEDRGLYMRRFILSDRSFGGLFVHVFYRSDEDPDCHCHPWNFFTFVLRGGYQDETWEYSPLEQPMYQVAYQKTMKAGAFGVRRAEHMHRVRLLDPSRRTWTFVVRGPKRREWYFYTPQGRVHWKTYLGVSS